MAFYGSGGGGREYRKRAREDYDGKQVYCSANDLTIQSQILL